MPRYNLKNGGYVEAPVVETEDENYIYLSGGVRVVDANGVVSTSYTYALAKSEIKTEKKEETKQETREKRKKSRKR